MSASSLRQSHGELLEIIANGALGADGANPASISNPAPVALPNAATVSASFARVADTNGYVSGDIIGDSTTAATMNANVTPGTAGIMVLAVARAADQSGGIRRLRLKTNDTAFASKTVRVHLYKDRPTLTNGDNGAWLTTESSYIGSSDILLDKTFSDYVKGIGVPAAGGEFIFEPSSGTANIYAVLECRDTVTPGSAKTWTLTAEVVRN